MLSSLQRAVLFLFLVPSLSSSFSVRSNDLSSFKSTPLTPTATHHRLEMAGNTGATEGDGSSESAPDPQTQEEEPRTLFAGFDLGTSGCRVSIIEPMVSSNKNNGGGFREVYSDSLTWKECVGSGSTSSEGRYDDPDSWWIAIEALLRACSASSSSSSSSLSLLDSVASICVSGTSASCLVVDRTTLEVTRSPRMYDYDATTAAGDGATDGDTDTSGAQTAELLEKHLPPKHTARSSTGSFAKLVKWILQSPLGPGEMLCHQSDYVSTKLVFSRREDEEFRPHSDWQNCLKLGYDVRNLCWPWEDWMGSCLREATEISGGKGNSDDEDEDRIRRILPTRVVSPGAPLGIVNEKVAKQLGLPEGVIVVGGTTDSNAAFYAAAAATSADNSGSSDNKITIPYGTAVTSLGSTTAIKFLSKTYVEDSTLGVYSHRFPTREVFDTATSVHEANGNELGSKNDEREEAWLVGGASNVGCAVFRALDFSDDELKRRSEDIDPTTDSEAYLRHKYYPLLPNKVGERFPQADATKQSVLGPLPEASDDENRDVRTEYLKGLFQSISTEVERKGYEVLRDLGASPPFPTRIMTAGGGSKNDVWTSLRERIMNESAGSSDPSANSKRVEVRKAECVEASYGAALLAAAGFRL